jgi:hypothetical protein
MGYLVQEEGLISVYPRPICSLWKSSPKIRWLSMMQENPASILLSLLP